MEIQMKTNTETIEITTDFIRLDSLMKFAGITPTGGEAKTLITEGLVQVNGEPCLMRGKKLHPGDEVSYRGRKLRLVQSAAEN